MPIFPLDEIEIIRRLFMPEANRRRTEVIESGGRFAYYTTADVAASVLTREQLWLRNTRVMNDSTEVEHGFACLNAAYKSPHGVKLKSILDECFPGLAQEVEALFNYWLPRIRTESFIACVSVHHDSEDKNGRLSMWRAYGGRAGVALVLNGEPLFSPADVGVNTSPVAYFGEGQFQASFEAIVDRLDASRSDIQRLGREKVKSSIFNMFRFAALATKHPGFAEEQEWRIVAAPSMYTPPSSLIEESFENVRQVPQKVIKLNLKDHPEQGLVGVNLNDFLNRIIIGPCDFPHVIADTFLDILKKKGIQDAAERIVVSDIPLRHF